MISLFFSSLITRYIYIYIFFLSTNPLAITGAIVARARIEHPPRQIPGTTHNTQPLPLPLSTCRQPPFQPFFSSFLHGPSDSLFFFFLPVDGGVYPAHVSRGKRIYSRWTGERTRERRVIRTRAMPLCFPSAIGLGRDVAHKGDRSTDHLSHGFSRIRQLHDARSVLGNIRDLLLEQKFSG